ncbi:hypothetical protein B9S53_16220 [Arthrospira sp. O9.13F]|nr:hypothetical protein B9S53_16220 [Arthrospira sp. O9.13F]
MVVLLNCKIRSPLTSLNKGAMKANGLQVWIISYIKSRGFCPLNLLILGVSTIAIYLDSILQVI